MSARHWIADWLKARGEVVVPGTAEFLEWAAAQARDESARAKELIAWLSPSPRWCTNAQYEKFIEAAGHHKPIIWPGAHPVHPVLGVSQVDARAYCNWAQRELVPYDEQPEELTPLWSWCTEKGVLRGGSWDDHVRYARVSSRVTFTPSHRCGDFGFRCREVPGERT